MGRSLHHRGCDHKYDSERDSEATAYAIGHVGDEWVASDGADILPKFMTNLTENEQDSVLTWIALSSPSLKLVKVHQLSTLHVDIYVGLYLSSCWIIECFLPLFDRLQAVFERTLDVATCARRRLRYILIMLPGE